MAPVLSPAPLDAALLAEAAQMIRILGHPSRLRIVECLEHGEATVTSLQEELGMPQAIVSQQLAKMKAGGMVKCRREGSNVWYSVADVRVLRVLNCLRHCEPAEPRSVNARRRPVEA